MANPDAFGFKKVVNFVSGNNSVVVLVACIKSVMNVEIESSCLSLSDVLSLGFVSEVHSEKVLEFVSGSWHEAVVSSSIGRDADVVAASSVNHMWW